MSEIIYKNERSNIKASKGFNSNQTTDNIAVVAFVITISVYLYLLRNIFIRAFSPECPFEVEFVACLLFVIGIIASLMAAFTASFGMSWKYPMIPAIVLTSTARPKPIKIPLSPTSPNPCEEPEFKAAFTKAINEMKAEIDKIEAERAEKNARRKACVASLKEMAK